MIVLVAVSMCLFLEMNLQMNVKGQEMSEFGGMSLIE